MKKSNLSITSVCLLFLFTVAADQAQADQAIFDNLSVEGALCTSNTTTCDDSLEDYDLDDNGSNDADVKIEDDRPILIFEDSDGQDWTMGANDNGLSNLVGPFNGFWIANITQGRTVFRIDNAVPENLLSLAARGDGRIGIGTFLPNSTLHVKSEEAQVRVENSSSSDIAERTLLRLENDGGVNFKLHDKSVPGTLGEWTFRTGVSGTKFVIGKTGSGVQELSLESGGNLKIAGNLTQGSDRTKKENIHAIDNQDILDKVLDLPISQWNYKHDDDHIKHIGPMAEDFHELFEVGNSPKTISSLDTSGVVFAAIQALNEKLEKRDDRIAALEASNRLLMQRLSRLEFAQKDVFDGHGFVSYSTHRYASSID